LPQEDTKQRKPDIFLYLRKKLKGWEPKVQLQEELIITIDYIEGLLSS
jgi:UDP-glucuronate decarboxylase